ncbi:hypothetical protein Droror1_Dr00019018 [Drosera rotundifolia]
MVNGMGEEGVGVASVELGAGEMGLTEVDEAMKIDSGISLKIERTGKMGFVVNWTRGNKVNSVSVRNLIYCPLSFPFEKLRKIKEEEKTAGKKGMKAIQYFAYGTGAAGLKHVKIPVPQPKADEVLVKVEASTINPVDWKIQKGITRPIYSVKFPHVPGTDLAGEVVKVGPAMKKFKPGDKIVAVLSLSTGGALAEYAVAKESSTVQRPEEVTAAQAAGLPIAGLTAYCALSEVAGIKFDGSGDKKNILITAGSGGVGHYAVQLAKLGNAHVTATCGSRNLDFIRSLGADEVLDYHTPEGATLKSPSGKKYDYVLHCATGIPWSTFEPNLSSKGKVIDLTPSPSAMLTLAVKKITFSKKQLVPYFYKPTGENLEKLEKLVEEGKVKTVVDSTYPLSKGEEAWAKLIDGHATGKIIIEH